MRLLSAFALCVSSFVSASAADRPNVLLFIADDMLYHDCGAYGSEVVRTPSIDRLAAEGMRFDRMFTLDRDVRPDPAATLHGCLAGP